MMPCIHHSKQSRNNAHSSGGGWSSFWCQSNQTAHHLPVEALELSVNKEGEVKASAIHESVSFVLWFGFYVFMKK